MKRPLLLIVAALASFTPWARASSLARLNVIFVVDGTHALLKPLLGQALYGSLAELENAPDAYVTVIKVCNTVNTLYSAHFSGDALELYGKLQKDLGRCTTKGSAITAGLERALSVVHNSSGPSVVVYLTDGGTADDPAPKGQLEAAGRALAAESGLKWVWAVGLGRQADVRQRLVDRLSMLERGHRLYHSGMSDVSETREGLWAELF